MEVTRIYVPDESAFFILALITGVFLFLSFIIVLCVRSVPNKLLLLGLFVAVMGIAFNAVVPNTPGLTIAMLILAVALVAVGLVCILIYFIAQQFRPPDKT